MTIISLNPEDIPLREGPPTKEELLAHYPAKFTWTELKTFINSGYCYILLWSPSCTNSTVIWAY